MSERERERMGTCHVVSKEWRKVLGNPKRDPDRVNVQGTKLKNSIVL